MWISSGEHELTENIIHLVLAKIPDENGKLVPGTRGISLFIVPKKMVNTDGELTGERNDVALAGLNHKCGWRGTTNTLLNFGEGKYPVGGEAGAVGYLVGQAGKGLHCMFHMMNEARIGVGMAATMLGMAGYLRQPGLREEPPAGPPHGPGRQRPGAAAGAHHRTRRCEAHAAGAEVVLRRRAGAGAVLRAAGRRAAHGRSRRGRRRAPAAGGADAHRQELAQRVVPGSQHPGDPDPRRLRLHARLPGGAVLARQPPEHDPRRHARHPGAWTCWAARC